MSLLPVAICQMTSVDDVEKNFEQIQILLSKIKEAKIIFFPENCLYMRLKEGEKIAGFEIDDSIFSRLSKLANERQLALHLGSVAIRENGKLSNATVFISADGEIRTTYRKIHLFDISLEGRPPIKESDVFNRGDQPSILEFEGLKLGQTICYDLRFAELFSYYAKKHVDIITVPAAFLYETGVDHWEVLLRARAIESQAFVIAAAQAGLHKSPNGERKTFGHSLIVSPWGTILAKGTSDSPELVELTLDLKLVEKVRRQIPMRDHRRL